MLPVIKDLRKYIGRGVWFFDKECAQVRKTHIIRIITEVTKEGTRIKDIYTKRYGDWCPKDPKDFYLTKKDLKSKYLEELQDSVHKQVNIVNNLRYAVGSTTKRLKEAEETLAKLKKLLNKILAKEA